jgi:hypothetical protein
MMEQQTSSEQTQGLPILLEVAPEDEQDVDPVAISEVGRSIVSELKQDGYAIEPVYTGQRGAVELLFTVMMFVQTVAVGAWTHLDVIAALCTVFETTKPVLERIFKVHEKHPIKISVVIDGAPVTVEAADLQEAEGALTLAKRFHTAHPSIKVTPQSQIKVRTAVQKPQQRRRR